MGSDWLVPVFGLVVGMLVGLTAMGGGVLMTPLLMRGLGLPATAVVGTDVAYSTVTTLVGAIPGVLIGGRLARWLPRCPLQLGLATPQISTAVTMLR